MKYLILLIYLIAFNYVEVYSHSILIQVIDSKDSSPLEGVYCYSYPFEGSYTVSDGFGFISIFISKENKVDTLALFKVGHRLLKIPVSEFLKNDTIKVELHLNNGIETTELSTLKSLDPKSILIGALDNTRDLMPTKHHQLHFFFREVDQNDTTALSLIEAVGFIDDQSYAKSLTNLKVVIKNFRKSDSFDQSRYLPTKRYIAEAGSSNLLYRTYERNFFRLAYSPGTVLSSVDDFLNKKDVFIADVNKSGKELSIGFNFLFTNGSVVESGTIWVAISESIIISFERSLKIDDQLMESCKIINAKVGPFMFPSYIKLQEFKVGQINYSLENSTYSHSELHVLNVITEEFEKITEKSLLSRISSLSNITFPYNNENWASFESRFPLDLLTRKKLEVIRPLKEQFLSNRSK